MAKQLRPGTTSANPGDSCPCGSGKAYAGCCGPLHQGAIAATPEALMRSRYSAYVLQLEAYLLDTWHPDTRPSGLDLDADPVRWLCLEVKQAPPPQGASGQVEFVARYKQQGRAFRLHEHSRFRLEGERWFYVDGEFPAPGAAKA